jgi:hypothetical protein
VDAVIAASRRRTLRSSLLLFTVIAALGLAPSAASAAWTVPPTPNVDGALSTHLSAVDCTSATFCMAVGEATFNPPGGTTTTVAERWDGTSWQIVPTPNPAGASFNSLDGVSCPGPTICFAVGRSDSEPLVEFWNGSGWFFWSSPTVPGGSLADVDCSGLLACTAVGASAAGTLAERFGATGWQVQSTPNPPGAESSRLEGVSCPLKRTCTAVGSSTAAGVNSPLVERWYGRVNSWGLQQAPKPAGAETSQLGAVSCPDGPVCLAVGSSQAPGGPNELLTERRVGYTWSILPAPDPGQGTGIGGGLSGVSCPAERACHAVGGSISQNGQLAFAERFDGSSWQLESVPAPPGPLPNLAGVSCPDRTFCMAVGGYSYLMAGWTLAARWTP